MTGRSPTGPGSRPSGRAAKRVSPVPASIPSAATMWERLGEGAFRHGYVQECVREIVASQLRLLMASRDMNAAAVAKAAKVKRDDVISILATNFDGKLAILQRIAGVFDVAIEARFLPYSEALAAYGYVASYDDEASAIEARRAETHSGSVEDESAGPKDDAQQVQPNQTTEVIEGRAR